MCSECRKFADKCICQSSQDPSESEHEPSEEIKERITAKKVRASKGKHRFNINYGLLDGEEFAVNELGHREGPSPIPSSEEYDAEPEIRLTNTEFDEIEDRQRCKVRERKKRRMKAFDKA